MKKQAAYGTWNSTLTGDYIAQASVKLSEPTTHHGSTYWLEGRPAENGRQAIVRRNHDGRVEDILPAPWNARTKAHEYGGGCYCIGDDSLFFCHGADQQIYRLNLLSREVTPFTQRPNCRFADLQYDAKHQRLIAVCEDHSAASGEPQNYLLALNIDADNNRSAAEMVIDAAHDFISNPRPSPCGRWLSYITWDHPNMPWDSTQLWLRQVDEHGQLSEPRCIAGAPEDDAVSLLQPQWSPGGDLFWVSDQSNWWNLYSLSSNDIAHFWDSDEDAPQPAPVYPHEAEYATPQWVFNMSSYGFLSADTIFATYTQNGVWQLVQLQHEDNQWRPTKVTTDLVAIANINCNDGRAVFVGAGVDSPLALFEFSENVVAPLYAPASVPLPNESISVARSISFPTSGGRVAHGFFYPPANAEFEIDENARPPVIVIGHGGPTGATDPAFSYKIQYWTHRGFAVLDVNYRGSTGFGRSYRQALQGQWGVVDVQDLCAAAEFVTAEGWVHPQQRIIRGSSAGGYSVLAALTDSDTFDAGVTLYGIGDLETLVSDTHKFESRYLDGLIGPYPEQKAVYHQRSPIHKVSNIRCPVLVFQGQEDKVVPPNQAEEIVTAVKSQGLPVGYVLYPEEGHGFRQSKNIAHQLEAELYFYQQVFGLGSPHAEPPVVIDNWESK